MKLTSQGPRDATGLEEHILSTDSTDALDIPLSDLQNIVDLSNPTLTLTESDVLELTSIGCFIYRKGFVKKKKILNIELPMKLDFIVNFVVTRKNWKIWIRPSSSLIKGESCFRIEIESYGYILNKMQRASGYNLEDSPHYHGSSLYRKPTKSKILKQAPHTNYEGQRSLLLLGLLKIYLPEGHSIYDAHRQFKSFISFCDEEMPSINRVQSLINSWFPTESRVNLYISVDKQYFFITLISFTIGNTRLWKIRDSRMTTVVKSWKAGILFSENNSSDNFANAFSYMPSSSNTTISTLEKLLKTSPALQRELINSNICSMLFSKKVMIADNFSVDIKDLENRITPYGKGKLKLHHVDLLGNDTFYLVNITGKYNKFKLIEPNIPDQLKSKVIVRTVELNKNETHIFPQVSANLHAKYIPGSQQEHDMVWNALQVSPLVSLGRDILGLAYNPVQETVDIIYYPCYTKLRSLVTCIDGKQND